MNEVSELQKKRAINIIWNSAGDYSFSPDFKAYDSGGDAEIYWNCIIGAVRRHYDYPQMEAVLRGLSQYEDAETYEGLFWLGLENCCFYRELPERPVLAALRLRYARKFVAENTENDDFRLYDALANSHFRRVLGLEVKMSGYDIQLLDELEFSPALSTEEIVALAGKLFEKWFQIRTQERRQKKNRIITPALSKLGKKSKGRRFSRFGLGFADHPDNVYGGSSTGEQLPQNELKTKMSASELRSFMEAKYGRPVFSPGRVTEIERSLCVGNHAFCHLHFTDGDRPSSGKIQNGFEALQRQREALQIEKNRRYFKDNYAANHAAIEKLSGKIQNSILLHLQPTQVKSNSGKLTGSKVWRALMLDDDRIFSRSEQDDMGNLSVDILLDASTSQKNRQETVSTQGYMIAESLSRCNVPCRVMSFCSMTGYTVLRIFRDYGQSRNNDKIFEYVSNGCNRDGLAISAAHYLMGQTAFEHKILIVLSDVKPNDVVKMRGSGDELTMYEQSAGVKDTAFEVRKAKADGISVICVFTGDDADVPAARTVYGRDFAKIQSLDHLASTVAVLLQNQIKNL